MKDEKAEVKVEKKSKDSDVIASISRRLSKVVKFLEEIHGADIDGDNRVGSVMTKLVVCIVSCFTVFSIAYAVEIVDNKSAGTGTYTLIQASNGTGDITLTVDEVVADVTGTVTADGIPITTYGNGALNTTNVTSVVEVGDGLSHQTVITLNGASSSIADGGFQASQLLYTFPAGRILIEGATCDITATMDTINFNASTADLYNVAVGSTINADGDGTISAVGANMIANISVDTDGGATQVNSVTGSSATGSALQIDGTSTAGTVILNWGVPAANDSGDNTNSFTGTITLTWKNLGDY